MFAISLEFTIQVYCIKELSAKTGDKTQIFKSRGDSLPVPRRTVISIDYTESMSSAINSFQIFLKKTSITSKKYPKTYCSLIKS